jgi:VCBS repeat-containing protein
VFSPGFLCATDDFGAGFELDEDTSIFVSANILANDIDPAYSAFAEISPISGGSAHLFNGNTVRFVFPESTWQHLTEGEVVTHAVDYTVTDTFGNSASATVTLTINGINDAPNAFFGNGSSAFGVLDAPRLISLRVSDVDSLLSQVVVQIDAGFEAGIDYLSVDTFGGVSEFYDPLTGTLTLQGLAPASTYDQILRDLQFQSIGDIVSPDQRTIRALVTDTDGATTETTRALDIVPFQGDKLYYDLVQNGGDSGHQAFRILHPAPSIGYALGDVNGDGRADLSIGGHTAAQIHLIPGDQSAFPVQAVTADLSAHVIRKSELGIPSRSAVAAGDVNLDGFGDILVSIPTSGQGYLIYGNAEFSALPDALSDIHAASGGTGDIGVFLDSEPGLHYDAMTLNAAGDVNADGFGDFKISAFRGETHIVYGRTAGFSAEYTLDQATASDPANGFRLFDSALVSAVPGLGSFESLGDVNGDQIDDFVLESPSNSFSSDVYVVFGDANAGKTDFDLASLKPIYGGNGSAGFLIGRGSDKAAAVGDFNGDGYADIGLIDSPNAYVVYGSAQTHGGHLELDNIGDAGDGRGIKFNLTSSDWTGNSFHIAGAGDVNADGYDDLLVSEHFADIPGRNDAGRLSLIFGSAEAEPTIDLRSLTPDIGVVFDGYETHMYLGYAVESLGDFDGDGYADFVINNGSTASSISSTTVVYGHDYRSEVEFQGTENADTLTGTNADEQLVAGHGDDLVDGGGGNDVIRAAAGDDVVVFDPADVLRVDGGSGIDTLLFSGADMVLDFDNLHSIENFERIDLSGVGDNTLRFDIRDILNLPGQAASFTDDHTLQVVIDGNAGDQVESQGQGWQLGASVNLGGNIYVSYTHADIAAQIFVDPSLTPVIS